MSLGREACRKADFGQQGACGCEYRQSTQLVEHSHPPLGAAPQAHKPAKFSRPFAFRAEPAYESPIAVYAVNPQLE